MGEGGKALSVRSRRSEPSFDWLLIEVTLPIGLSLRMVTFWVPAILTLSTITPWLSAKPETLAVQPIDTTRCRSFYSSQERACFIALVVMHGCPITLLLTQQSLWLPKHDFRS
jgi:hypothetical protein